MVGFLKSLVASAAVAVGRADLALQMESRASYVRALENARSRLGLEPLTPAAAYAAALRRLDGAPLMTFGTLPSRQEVRVRRDLGLMSALILGAT
ncbi:MAG: hypothetical protein JWO56_2840, partial [Acidobacteria bacterium]|nr:hypothetical protein [Acidobacteriota bacterium]